MSEQQKLKIEGCGVDKEEQLKKEAEAFIEKIKSLSIHSHGVKAKLCDPKLTAIGFGFAVRIERKPRTMEERSFAE